ncbi:hypothetical protein FB567DRAFT_265595 [Paraphoma chrysanthemicola]|uniref:Uncharacterized protein n=1 Tax=Paraphoma chrysanthemicola TaxID=798071 RepID=A0A8K0RDN9_9PLEO|nr:hypothetical protein FB567DRAFT_265595 [Paraphoma chrysanthemicola]
MASTETLSRTPPLPHRSPYRRLCTFDKDLPPLPTDTFQLETELVPKPLFCRSTIRPPKTMHIATIELPSLDAPSPIICPSDASTVSSNRSSMVSDGSRPGTPATSVPSEGPSRTSSFKSTAPPPTWIPPLEVPKPLFTRSATLPVRPKPTNVAQFTFQCPSPIVRRPTSPRKSFAPNSPALKTSPLSCFSPPPVEVLNTHPSKPVFGRSRTLPAKPTYVPPHELSARLARPMESPEPPRALNLPPPRNSPLTCFSPAPAWPRTVKGARPALRHKMTPRRETLRSLRAKESDACLQKMYDRQLSSYLEDVLEEPTPKSTFAARPVAKIKRPESEPEKRHVPEKPVALCSLRQHSYVMDDKGVFIMNA